MDWHARYTQQAGWTAQIRRYLYEKAGLSASSRVLEPGCGTGAILANCPATDLHGMDWERSNLEVALTTAARAKLVQADARVLPYSADAFDACLTHYFLLWVDSDRLMAEMTRVTRPGGVILALAEPDYSGRIDYPPDLIELGRLQAELLARQGADISMGRKLGKLFANAGLQRVTVGVMGGEWTRRELDSAWELEWAALESDLAAAIDPEDLARLRQVDAAAWQRGERILYVPTFYAIGWLPGK